MALVRQAFLAIRKDYPTTGVLKLKPNCTRAVGPVGYQEGLPDYWGIETVRVNTAGNQFNKNQEGLPDYWGIETFKQWHAVFVNLKYQEGLPDYWGIETLFQAFFRCFSRKSDQEGLPDYWGIETEIHKKIGMLF